MLILFPGVFLLALWLGLRLELAAEPDQPARRSDFVVFNRSSFFETTSLRVVRNVTAVDSMIYRSPFDIDPGFFLRARPTITNPLPPNPVAGVSATLRAFAQLAPPTSGMPLTVVASANSRGVRTHGVNMVTSRMLGVFLHDPRSREEVLKLMSLR